MDTAAFQRVILITSSSTAFGKNLHPTRVACTRVLHLCSAFVRLLFPARERIDNLTDRWSFLSPPPPPPSLSLSGSQYIHSRRIARRREGTSIIYEDRKLRSIDLSDRSRAHSRSLVRSRARQTRLQHGFRLENTLTRVARVYDATITAITVTLVELYRTNTISRVRHIRIHVCRTYSVHIYCTCIECTYVSVRHSRDVILCWGTRHCHSIFITVYYLLLKIREEQYERAWDHHQSYEIQRCTLN